MPSWAKCTHGNVSRATVHLKTSCGRRLAATAQTETTRKPPYNRNRWETTAKPAAQKSAASESPIAATVKKKVRGSALVSEENDKRIGSSERIAKNSASAKNGVATASRSKKPSQAVAPTSKRYASGASSA